MPPLRRKRSMWSMANSTWRPGSSQSRSSQANAAKPSLGRLDSKAGTSGSLSTSSSMSKGRAAFGAA
eukprot:2619337-Alexandrium_andersonii.AAC.1